MFYDGSVIRKLESLAKDYSAVKESVSDGKVMLDCVSQDLSGKIKGFEREFHKEVETLRGGKPLNFDVSDLIKSRAVKDKAMAAPVDDRTPLQKKKARKKAVKEEVVDIKPAQFLSAGNKDDYIPFPSKS